MMRLGLFLYDHLGWRRRCPKSTRSTCRRRRSAGGLQAVVQEGLRLFRRLGRRRAPGGLERARRASTGADDHHAPPLRVGARARRRRALERRTEGTERRHAERRARAGSSTPPGPWVGISSTSMTHVQTPQASGWSRAATSSCRSCSTTTTPIILQNPDKRIIFAIPYERDFTLIGTTDIDLSTAMRRRRDLHAGGDRLSVRAGEPLLREAGDAGRRGLDLLRRAAAVRRRRRQPLGGDARLSPRARCADGAAPLLSVFGGKITTYRKLAEHALEDLRKFYPQHGRAVDRAQAGGRRRVRRCALLRRGLRPLRRGRAGGQARPAAGRRPHPRAPPWRGPRRAAGEREDARPISAATSAATSTRSRSAT